MERESNSLSLSNRYQIGESIGEGGMGVVVKAHDQVLKIDVAIKMLGIDHTGIGAARLQREATAAGRLSHPNIARIYDFGQWEDGKPYMVMEYLSGQSLAAFIADKKSLTCAQALPIFIQIAQALAYAHTNKIIHRDLKPSNIMLVQALGGEKQVKILDFGIAKIVDQSLELTQKGAVVGSPLYISPEQAQGDDATMHSDIYSFGCLMFEIHKTQLLHFFKSKLALVAAVSSVIALAMLAVSIFDSDQKRIVETKTVRDAEPDHSLVDDPRKQGKFKSVTMPGIVVKYYTKETVASADESATDESLKILTGKNINTLIFNAGKLNGSGLKYLDKEYLKSISMLNSNVDDDVLKSIEQFPNISSVSVGSDKITDKGIAYLADLENLSTLRLKSSGITSGVITSLIKMKKLTHLSLAMRTIDSQFLDGFSHLEKLEDLELDGVALGDSEFESIARIKSLDILRLGHAEFEPKSLRKLSGQSSLLCIDLSGCRSITDELISELIALDRKSLLFGNTNLTDRQLLKLSKSRGLRFLRVSGCAVSDDAIEGFEQNFRMLWKRPIKVEANMVN